MSTVLNITHSILGQRWQWRSGDVDARDPGFQPDDLVTQLLMARGVPRDDIERHREPTIRGFMPDPSIFSDMDIAAERLADAVEAQEQVTIYGDYDVDGATSAALLIRLLRDLGLAAGHYIPDRLMEGYGPSGEALVRIGADGSRLIVTVDCGAMAYDALAQAKAAGLEVIVVDHHKCAVQLPAAFALVNPNRLDECDEAASHGHLAAVGVAFLLAAAVVRVLRLRGFFERRAEPKLIELLDIVALGTVADVAQLRGLNRAFVAQGLKVMAGRRNIGLAALIEASRLNRAPVCSDLGFALGPRINAGGRVGKSDLGVRLLTTEDRDEARTIASELNRLNEERRAIESAVQDEAESMIQGQHNKAVVLLAGQGWHPGVIGIVAGRIKEKTGKPSIIIALDENGTGKGSGRSIGGVDLGAAIISAREAGLLEAGGGHAMAAGLTVKAENIEALSDWLDQRLEADVARASSSNAVLIDALLSPHGLNPAFIDAMEAAGPYGMGWPGPRIVTGPVRIIKCDIVGKDHVRAIVSGDDGASFKAMAFRQGESLLGQQLLHGKRGQKYWITGRAKVDDWGSTPKAELHIDDIAFAD
ncbi:single-stranded-DNA-specific exonuclease RecJ [Sphingorhabdus sp. IMCC26285]|uniref:Single-stranded-DNA-specific exonuclease RecJ n=1 Tax=Sphingorhabdus profundilacus TaxID=2509718 RepID=A0A6I4M020_9SPHN|nr:single-stranded-DNA-specific exonuclease RecJ [Sphingorhabdus profundilacus]MVZ98499.1 single-stranded-DNA-specific exonuclease RecJ [Sphingorhabdus profundilacus]